MRGDQNDGRVVTAAAEVGERTPEAVLEVDEPGPTDIAAGATTIYVSSSHGI